MNGMAERIVITKKTTQAKDIRDAVGHRYGTILPAEGHLFDLVVPEDVEPSGRRWSATLLRPDGEIQGCHLARELAERLAHVHQLTTIADLPRKLHHELEATRNPGRT